MYSILAWVLYVVLLHVCVDLVGWDCLLSDLLLLLFGLFVFVWLFSLHFCEFGVWCFLLCCYVGVLVCYGLI